jgi:hypothetical protein
MTEACVKFGCVLNGVLDPFHSKMTSTSTPLQDHWIVVDEDEDSLWAHAYSSCGSFNGVGFDFGSITFSSDAAGTSTFDPFQTHRATVRGRSESFESLCFDDDEAVARLLRRPARNDGLAMTSRGDPKICARGHGGSANTLLETHGSKMPQAFGNSGTHAARNVQQLLQPKPKSQTPTQTQPRLERNASANNANARRCTLTLPLGDPSRREQGLTFFARKEQLEGLRVDCASIVVELPGLLLVEATHDTASGWRVVRGTDAPSWTSSLALHVCKSFRGLGTHLSRSELKHTLGLSRAHHAAVPSIWRPRRTQSNVAFASDCKPECEEVGDPEPLQASTRPVPVTVPVTTAVAQAVALRPHQVIVPLVLPTARSMSDVKAIDFAGSLLAFVGCTDIKALVILSPSMHERIAKGAARLCAVRADAPVDDRDIATGRQALPPLLTEACARAQLVVQFWASA